MEGCVTSFFPSPLHAASSSFDWREGTDRANPSQAPLPPSQRKSLILPLLLFLASSLSSPTLIPFRDPPPPPLLPFPCRDALLSGGLRKEEEEEEGDSAILPSSSSVGREGKRRFTCLPHTHSHATTVQRPTLLSPNRRKGKGNTH